MPPVVGFIGGVITGITTGVAAGAGIGGAFAAGMTFGATVLTGLGAKLLTSVAMSALQMALTKRKSAQGGGLTISTTLRGEQNPETIILGRTATGGQAICPPYSHGGDNNFLTHVVELCSAPGATFERLVIGDEYVEFGDTPHPEYGLPVTGEKYGGLIWLKYYDGSQTVADPMMRAKYGAHPDRPWTDKMVGYGLCYAILTFQYDQSRLGQVPRYRFEMLGIPLYDRRKDSTAGGLGSQRWDNPTTWEQTENAGVIAWNIKRGIKLPGGQVWGGQVSLDNLPAGDWMLAANQCAAAVDVGDGKSEPYARAGIEAPLNQEPAAVQTEILKACSGAAVDNGGVWKIRIGGPGLPVLTIQDEDILRSKAEELDPFPSLAETWNSVAAQYPDPEALWETRDAPPRHNAAWEASDRFGRRTADLSLPAVPYPLQVQRLMRAWIEDERRFGRHIINLPSDATVLEPLDCLAWHSGRNGYDGKLFEVAEVVEEVLTCTVQVSLREVDPEDYDWQPEFALPSVPVTTGTTPLPPAVVSGFGAEPVILTDAAGGNRRGGVRLSWNAALLADGLKWQFRAVPENGEILTGGLQDLSLGATVVTEGLIPGGIYDVSAGLITDRPALWTDWIRVAVPDIRLGEADLAQSITDRIRDAQARADAAFARHDATLTEADGALGALRDQLGLTLGDFIGQPLPAIPLLELMPLQIGRIDALDQQITLDLMPLVPMVPGAIARIDALQATLDLEWPRIWGAEDAIDDLRQRLSASAMELGMLGQRVTDAGVYVDPVTGQVRISGMQALDGRVTSAEIRMDGVEAQITLRATEAWVNRQISNAMFDPSQIPVLDDFELRLTTAEIALDGVKATLEQKASSSLVEGLALQMTAAQVRLDGITANIALLATKTALDETSARVNAAEIQLAALDAPSITFTVEATRAQFDEIDAATFATLDELMTGYRDREALRRANASAQQQLAANVQDGLAAEATARLSLQAQLANTTAMVTVEQRARADADAALAEQITTLFAATGTNAAAITTEATARTNADGALGQRIDTVQSQTENNTAAIENETLARTTLAGAVAQQTEILRVESDLVDDALWATLIETITGDEDRSRIRQAIAEAQRQTTVTVQDGFAAEASERLVLQAQIATSAALIRAEQLARATGDEALAQQLVQLQAQLGDQAALIATEATTRANADGALGQRIDTVQAQAGDNAAAIQQEQTTRANADGALGQRLDTVQSQTEANAAAITREEEARSTLAGAVAQQTEILRVESDLIDEALWATLLETITGEEDRSRIRQAIAEAQRQTTVTVQDGFAAEAAERLVLQAQIATSAALIRAEQLARATGDEALAQQLVQLQAQLGDQAALIATEATTRANADGAMAGQIQTVQATAESRNRTFRQTSVPADPVAGDLWFDTADGNRARRWAGTAWVETSDSRTAQNAAAIATEATARADGDSALGQRIDTVQAAAADNAAQIRAEETTRADADGALAGQILTVRATADSRNRTFRQSGVPAAPVAGDLWFDSADGNRARRWSGTAWVDTDNTRLAQNAAAITSEAAARADADGALGQRIDTVQAQAGDNAAAISSEATTRASADSALAGQIETVRVQTQDNAAAIGTEAVTRADEDAALAGQMSVVRATANSRNRTFRQSTAPANPVAGDLWFDTASGDQQLRWSGTAWLPVTDARVAQNAAAIANEAATRADADTALATQLATVSAQAGGTAATVEEQAGAIARIDGYTAATYSLRLTGGGATAAFEMVASNNPLGPASSVRIASKHVRLDGDVEVTGDFLAKEIFATGAWIKRAAIEEGAIGSAQIGNVIQSANFTEGPTGDGWQINKDGRIIANNIIIRRQIEVAAGSVNVGNITLPAGPVDNDSPLNPDWAKPGPVVWVRSTPIAISEWQGARRTYIATAGMSGGVNAPNYALPDAYWGWDAQVLPLTRWEPGDIGQSLRLRLQFWSRNVLSVSNCVVNWKIYEVS